jgi:4a-hydroxytetrahydrobiopterin dehydratase
MPLADEQCAPIPAGTQPLTDAQASELAPQVARWRVADASLVREVKFPGFPQAIAFVNAVAALAEQCAHHPDIDIRYNKVRLVLSTHRIGGLSRNDFILAAQIDAIGA